MQTKKTDNKRQKRAAALAILLAAVLILGIVLPVIGMTANAMTVSVSNAIDTTGEETTWTGPQPAAEVENPDLHITAKVGFDGTYLLEHATPFAITLENTGADFTGQVEVKVYSYLGDEYTDASYSVYYQPVELSSGGVKRVDMEITVVTLSKFFQISLVDAQGKVVCRKNVTVTPRDPGTVMVGLLSDHPENLAYAQSLALAGGMDRYDQTNYDGVAVLSRDSLSQSMVGLDSLAVLIVNDFDTTSLSAEQVSRVGSWLEEGGTLVLGSGPNAPKTLGGLADALGITLGERTSLSSLSQLSEWAGSPLTGTMELTRLSLENGEAVVTEEGEPLVWQARVGSGSLLCFTCDLGLAPLSGATGAGTVLESILKETDPGLLNINYRYNRDQYYNNLSYAAGNSGVPESGRLKTVFIVLIAYIAVVGPVLYLVLKKKDKREMGWIVIPVMAIAVTAGIYGLSLSSGYRKGLVNLVTVTDRTGDRDESEAGTVQVYGSVASPRKGDVTLSLDENIHATPSDNNRYYYRGYRGQGYTPTEIYFARIHTGDTTEITYIDQKSWNQNTFSGEAWASTPDHLEVDLTIEGDTFVGSIHNTGETDYFDVVLQVGSEYFVAGDVAAGDTLEISHSIASNLQGVYSYDSYAVLDMAFGGIDNYGLRLRVKAGELTSERAYQIGQRANLLTSYLNSNTAVLSDMTGSIPVGVYAFNQKPLLSAKPQINGKDAQTLYCNLYCFTSAIDMTQVKDFDIPGGLIQPNRVWGEGDGFISSEGVEVYVERAGVYYISYGFQTSQPLELIQFTANPDYGVVNGQILNVTTGEYEDISTEAYTNPEDYRDAEGNIVLRYEIDEDYTSIAKPSLRVKGGNGE